MLPLVYKDDRLDLVCLEDPDVTARTSSAPPAPVPDWFRTWARASFEGDVNAKVDALVHQMFARNEPSRWVKLEDVDTAAGALIATMRPLDALEVIAVSAWTVEGIPDHIARAFRAAELGIVHFRSAALEPATTKDVLEKMIARQRIALGTAVLRYSEAALRPFVRR